MQRDSFICSPLLPASWLTEFDADFQNLVTDWTTLMLIVTGLCFVVSEITKNHSEVDKLWSLLPPAYSWVTVAAFPSARTIIMALLVTMWGLRLSYNFHGMEDTISSPGGARRITGGKYSGTAPH